MAIKELVNELNEHLLNYEKFQHSTTDVINNEIRETLFHFSNTYGIQFSAKYSMKGDKFDFNAVSRFEKLNDKAIIFYCTKFTQNKIDAIAELIRIQIKKLYTESVSEKVEKEKRFKDFESGKIELGGDNLLEYMSNMYFTAENSHEYLEKRLKEGKVTDIIKQLKFRTS